MEQSRTDMIKDEAAYWYARLHSPECSRQDRDNFEEWLNRDAAHQEAFQQTIATAERVAAGADQHDRLRAMADQALRDLKRESPRRFRIFGLPTWAAVTALVVTVVAGVVFRPGSGLNPFDSCNMVSYVNHSARGQRIALSDGTTMYLDADSEVVVSISRKARRVLLEQGRVYVDVAEDGSRPFTVAAGGIYAEGQSGQFEVDMQAEGQVDVSLAAGIVQVTERPNSGSWLEVLIPGQRLNVDQSTQKRMVSSVGTHEIASWISSATSG